MIVDAPSAVRAISSHARTDPGKSPALPLGGNAALSGHRTTRTTSQGGPGTGRKRRIRPQPITETRDEDDQAQRRRPHPRQPQHQRRHRRQHHRLLRDRQYRQIRRLRLSFSPRSASPSRILRACNSAGRSKSAPALFCRARNDRALSPSPLRRPCPSARYDIRRGQQDAGVSGYDRGHQRRGREQPGRLQLRQAGVMANGTRQVTLQLGHDRLYRPPRCGEHELERAFRIGMRQGSPRRGWQ